MIQRSLVRGRVTSLPPYNSNFQYFEIKSLVPRTSDLRDSTVYRFECIDKYIFLNEKGTNKVRVGVNMETRPQGYKTFFMLNFTEPEMNHVINVKMPTFISVKNT